MIRKFALAALLTAVPWLSAAAQSPQSFYTPMYSPTVLAAPQYQAVQQPAVQYQVVPMATPLAKCFTAAPAPVQVSAVFPPTAWVGTVQPRQITWGPTPIGTSLAWVGQRMQGLGTRHVWTLQHTRLAPLAVQQQPVYYQAVQMPAPVQYQAVQQPIQYQAVQPSAQHSFLTAPPAGLSEAVPAPPEAPKPPTPKPTTGTELPGPMRIGMGPEE